jgi:uncharacterized protein
MENLEIILFFVAPMLGAAINSVAGGGTFLTFPVFTMAGLSPLQANVMSTIALWPGAVSSAYGYRAQLATEKRSLLPLVAVCLVGGTAGSLTLLHTPEVLFSAMVPWLLLAATLIFTFGRHGVAYLHRRFPQSQQRPTLAITFQLLISFYGGYFGAGIGILMLAMLQLMGQTNIHQMNALKTLLGGAINLATVMVFVLAGWVLWDKAAIMVAGGMLGGYIGARAALRLPASVVRYIVSVIGFSMTAYFFVR